MRGRDTEWQMVGQLLRRTRTGVGGVILVDGERGTGKSLLLREAGHAASVQGFSLAAGAADPLGGKMPFFALHAALWQPSTNSADGGHWPESDSLPRQIRELRERLVQRTAAGPVLLSLDDLQWAGEETMLALRILPRQLARYPVAWILARSYGRRGADAECLFSALEGEGARRVTLGPLPADVATGMLADAFGAPPDESLTALAAGAGGNPSLLADLIGGLRDEDAIRVSDGRATLALAQLPRRAGSATRRWLACLSGSARRLLGTAAVLGEAFQLDDIAEMLGEPPSALLPGIEEALDIGILAAGDEAFSFRHSLMFRAAAELIPPPARRALHRQFGEILLGRGGAAATAAAHLLEAAQAGDPASLAGLDMGAAAVLRSSPQTAADLALRALQLTRPAETAALPRAVAAAEALTAAGRPAQAARIVDEALARPVPADAEARLRCTLSSILNMSGQARDAGAQAEKVLALPDLGNDLRDDALAAWLQAATWRSGDQAARRVASTILSSESGHAGQAVAAARTARAMSRWDEGKIVEAIELLREAARDGGVFPDARHCQPLLMLSARLIDLRRLDEAASIIQAAGDRAAQCATATAGLSILRARIQLARGLVDEATADGEVALAAAESAGADAYTAAAHSVLSAIALRRGEQQTAARHSASRAVLPSHIATTYAAAETAVTAAQAAKASQGPGAVISEIRELYADPATLHRFLLGDPALAAWLVRTALAAADRPLAQKAAATAIDLAKDNPGWPTIDVGAVHARGLLTGDEECLAYAATQHEDPWARASAAEDLAVLITPQAGQQQAIEHLNVALQQYGHAGATADMARIRARLRKFGVRRRHWETPADRPVIGWGSLTTTERAVSELVVQGLTNQQAADRLYISQHTVAHHLRQVYRKLSIGSRVELARVVMEQSRQLEQAEP
jgi:DNA-binding CsgD family transcriptional regulator